MTQIEIGNLEAAETARVLIIDDDPADGELVRRAAKRTAEPLAFEYAADRAAFEALLERGPVDLVIADLIAPFGALDVIELLKRGEHTQYIPVLVVSSTGLEEDVMQSLRAGACDFVGKSHLERLPHAVEQALRLRRVLRSRGRAREELARSEKLYRTLFEASAVPSYVMDTGSLRILDANQAMTRLYGHSHEQLLAMSAGDLRPDGEANSLARHLSSLKPGALDRGIFRHRKRDGEIIEVEVQASEIDYDGRPARFAAVSDLSLQRGLEQALDANNRDIARLIEFDPLTNLPNRAAFLRIMAETLGRSPAALHAVALVDLKGFRAVSDGLGAQLGDMLLQQVAERLRRNAREGEIVARLGNDEFALLLPHLDSQERILERARVLGNLFEAGFSDGADEIRIAASIGMAVFPEHGGDGAALLCNAGLALAEAKRCAPGHARAFEPRMADAVAAQLSMARELRKAITQHEFVLHYQPRFDFGRRRSSDVEALLRWRRADGTLTPPGDFIPALEENGLIIEVGEWVLAEAARQARAWLDAGVPLGRMAVNVSARQFAQANLVERFVDLLERAGVPASMFELELTESCLMRDPEQAAETLAQLKRRGFHLAIDDFGTGHSSLAYLKRFPVEVLKIDLSFVQCMVSEPGSAAIVRATIALGHSLQLRVVAEGVENEAQAVLLERMGCDDAQGFLYARPLIPDACAEYLTQGGAGKPHAVDTTLGRTVLLVDDEPNILKALQRALRREGYRLLTAPSGRAALELLAQHAVDVIISDQRMAEMSGVEFLSRVKELYPETIRIVLSGYTDLESVTDAINRGAIYKFLTKPWDDEHLRENIREAFHRKELASENRRLSGEISEANRRLAEANNELEMLLADKSQLAERARTSLEIAQEMLEHMPLPVVAVAEDGLIALANGHADRVLGGGVPLIGGEAAERLPAEIAVPALGGEAEGGEIVLEACRYSIAVRPLGIGSSARGRLVVLAPVASGH